MLISFRVGYKNHYWDSIVLIIIKNIHKQLITIRILKNKETSMRKSII